MRMPLLGTALVAVTALHACTPAGQSSADSAAAAAATTSTPAGVGAAIPDTGALTPGAKPPAQPVARAAKSSSKRPGTTTKPQVKAPIVEDDIVGKDSVIKDRFRVVPRP